MSVTDDEISGYDYERPRSLPVDNAWHRGDWMQTFTGRQFYPMAPRAEDIDPVDIAHSLAMQCRYNGHVDGFYSVAEHCVLMSQAVPEEFALWALLHDATEAYVGDMVRPLKLSLPIFAAVEDTVMVQVARRFDLSISFDQEGWEVEAGVLHPKVMMPAVVKDADSRILLTERATLMAGKAPASWRQDGLEPLAVKITGWTPGEGKQRYLERLAELGAL